MGTWVAVAVAALLGAEAPAGDARQRLKAVGEELTQEQLDVERLLSQEGSLLQAIDGAALDAEAAEAALAQAKARHVAALTRLGAARAREEAAQATAAARLEVLLPRLRAWQRLSPGRRAELLLSAGGAQEAAHRAAALRLILGHDLAELRGTLAELKVAKSERVEVAALSAELARRGAESLAAGAEAKARRARHTALLAAVREERGLHERAAKELAGAQDHLSAVVVALPAERMVSTDFSDSRGSLPAPVEGHIEIGFGPILNPRFNTTTLQKGIDFRAPQGTPVRAVHRGRVVHAGWFSGYGNLLIIDHGDGYFTLFAHLATLKPAVNDLVEVGDEVATVGDTGSLKGPYLYFEIRHHGEAIDPALWFAPPREPAAPAAPL